MSEENKTDQANPEAEVMDVVSAIADNKRADAIDKLQDLLYARSSDAVDQYKKTVAATYEGKGDSKKLYIEGVFLQSELKNRNGRMYPFSVLQKEVNRYNEEYIKTSRALGELGHPDGPTVNLDRVSHRIVSLEEDGTNFRGKAQILDTPMGKIASSLLGEGVKLGVSSRGMGSIDKREDVNVVMDDFMLATAADIVADPSAPDAFVNGIMEGKEWAWDNGILKETKVAKYQSYMNNATRKNLEERTLRVFEDFLSGL